MMMIEKIHREKLFKEIFKVDKKNYLMMQLFLETLPIKREIVEGNMEKYLKYFTQEIFI